MNNKIGFSMNNVKKFFVTLAFIGLCISTVMAQSTYSIGWSGSKFQIYKDGSTFFSSPFIQQAIDFIRDDVNTAGSVPCIIQFGVGDGPYSVFDLGGGNATLITFENTATKTWGEITLTGKATTACATEDGIIRIENPVSVECKAEITATANSTFLFSNKGTLTISGGAISTTGKDGCAVVSEKTLTISGGTISETGEYGYAVVANGNLTISGGTITGIGKKGTAVACTGLTTINNGEISVTGEGGAAVVNFGVLTINNGEIFATVDGTFAVVSAFGLGTIFINGGRISGSGTGVIDGKKCMLLNTGNLIMSGGTIECTSNFGNTILNLNTAEISGGIVTSKGGEAITNEHDNAQLTIKGNAKVLAQEGYAVVNTKGTVNISDGVISTNSTSNFTIKNSASTTISGGTIENTHNFGNTIGNSETGLVAISGGTVKSKGGNAVTNVSIGMIDIKEYGRVFSQEGYAVKNTGGGMVNISNNSIVFAYGTIDTDIIQGSYTRSNNAVIAAWDNTVGTTAYIVGTSKDIYKLPEVATATAVWAKQGSEDGISIKYGGTEGFIPIADVTVGSTGIATVETDKFFAYPNPVGDVLHFSIETPFEIIDLQGKTVQKSNKAVKYVNINSLPSGTYFVTLTTEIGKIVRKVIKE